VYTQGDMTAKRAALLQVSGIFVVAEDGLNLTHQQT
jgi:hypothetical protein